MPVSGGLKWGLAPVKASSDDRSPRKEEKGEVMSEWTRRYW
jgi:hypothetical protein